MKKIYFILFGLFFALPAFAQDALSGLKTSAGQAGLTTGLGAKTVPEIIGSVVGYALSFIGVLFMIMMIYGGISWMTSFGNTEKVNKAKELITSAVIGLIIVIAAYAITSFVVDKLVTTTVK